MAFDPISWMFTFSLGQAALRVIRSAKSKELARKLRQAIKEWGNSRQPPIDGHILESIFSSDVDESEPQNLVARKALSQMILDKSMPSTGPIRDALLERWDEIRRERPEQDLVAFFQLDRDDATSQLNDLAAQIRNVLKEDPSLFQVTVVELLENLTDKIDLIAERVPSDGPQSVADDSPVFTVPYPRHNCFEGREDVLVKLRRALVGGKKAAISQVIRGLGGIGKTQTAVEYAYEHQQDYKAVLWIKASTQLEIRQDMADAAKQLKLPHDETKLEDGVRALMLWLEQNSDWLLIFDNADDPELLKPFMPRTQEGHILLTSRASVFDALGILNPIELPLLSVEDAAEFLLKRTGRDGSDEAEVESAKELANELGLLPLALEQAGAYILALGIGFEAYRQRRLELLQRGQPVMGDYAESVATTWLVNFEEVASRSEASADLLRLSAFLGADNIPFELMTLGASATECALAATISESDDPELTILEVLQPLSGFSLVTIDTNNKSYSIHRLVQEAIRHSLDEADKRTWSERAVYMGNEAFPSPEFENWTLCGRLVSHAVAAVTRPEALAIETDAVARLAHQAAYFLSEQAQYDEAEPLYKQALEINRVALGERHPDFAASVNNLGGLYRQMGQLADAEQLSKQSMEIWRVALGERHPNFATSLSNLAHLYFEMGRLSDAEPLHEQSMEIRRVTLGEQHPEFASSLNNLAELYREMGRLDEAEPLYKQSLEITRDALGEQHPNFASSLNNLALLSHATGRHDEAERLLKQSIEIKRDALGEQHPDFAAGLNNLAELYRDMGRLTEAEPLCKQSMAIIRAALGEQHPDFATRLNNLALLYMTMGRHAEAEPLYKRSMEITRVALGEQHPNYAIALNSLAGLYRDMGRHAEAEPLYNQAMEIIRATLGEQHPNYATALNNLAGFYRAMGRDDEAAELEGKAR